MRSQAGLQKCRGEAARVQGRAGEALEEEEEDEEEEEEAEVPLTTPAIRPS